MSNQNKKKKTRTTYYQSRSQTSKNLFHSPQAYGKLLDIPMTAPMKVISVFSVILQAALTVLAFYLAFETETIPALEESGFSSSYLYLVLPFVTWVITLGFRFTCRAVPLEMWRLPQKVKQGMIRLQGQPLKLATLLVELETAVCFCYIALALWRGGSPSNPVLLLWLAALALSIFFPCRAAARQA